MISLTKILNMCQYAVKNLEAKVGEDTDIYETIGLCTFDVFGKAGFGIDFKTQTTKNEGGYVAFLLLFKKQIIL